MIRMRSRTLAPGAEVFIQAVRRLLGEPFRLQSTSCTFVLTAYAVPVTAIHAVYPSRRHLSAKVRAFTDVLAAAFARPAVRGR